jgi:hypothetical protein
MFARSCPFDWNRTVLLVLLLRFTVTVWFCQVV